MGKYYDTEGVWSESPRRWKFTMNEDGIDQPYYLLRDDVVETGKRWIRVCTNCHRIGEDHFWFRPCPRYRNFEED